MFLVELLCHSLLTGLFQTVDNIYPADNGHQTVEVHEEIKVEKQISKVYKLLTNNCNAIRITTISKLLILNDT